MTLPADTPLAGGSATAQDIADAITAHDEDEQAHGFADITAVESDINQLQGNVALLQVVPLSFVLSGKGEAVDAVAADAGPTFRMPFDATLLEVRLAAGSACTTGTLTVDVNESASSVLSTPLTIDAGETTSETAAVPAVISDAVLAADAPITFDIDDEGDGTATDVTVTMLVQRVTPA